jgi:hypothetical protein
MPQELTPGDFLIYQLESGYGLLRLLGFEGEGDDRVWHLCAYEDFFADVDQASHAADMNSSKKSIEHLALTSRAFESTQVAKLNNVPVTTDELDIVSLWKDDPERVVSDRSIRLMLGFR